MNFIVALGRDRAERVPQNVDLSGVHVSPSSAETLGRKGGITNRHSIVYSPSNISAKNHRNQLMWVEVMLCNISVVF